MNKKIAIQGCPIKGAEVLQALEDMGGKEAGKFSGRHPDYFYYIGEDDYVEFGEACKLPKDYTCITLEQYLDSLKAEEVVLWITRDKEGILEVFNNRPTLLKNTERWHSDKDYMRLEEGIFPEITFENSPKKVKLILAEEE